MKAFELPAGTRVKLTKATPRKEHHGDELKQAISLRLHMDCSGDLLNALHPGLQDVLLWRPPELDAQESVPGVPEVKPALRVPIIVQPIKLDLELTGYTLTIDHGIDEDDPLELYLCTLGKFAVEAKQGGGASIEWSVSTNKEITKELLGELCDLEGSEVSLEQVAPTPAAESIDGSVEAFKRDHPDADDGQGDLLGGSERTPEQALAESGADA